MGFRFRKSIKIAPGVRINLSKSGMSTSVGGDGLTVNVRPGGRTRITASLPGTGISYGTTAAPDAEVSTPRQRPRKRITAMGWFMRYVIWCVLLAALYQILH